MMRTKATEASHKLLQGVERSAVTRELLYQAFFNVYKELRSVTSASDCTLPFSLHRCCCWNKDDLFHADEKKGKTRVA